MKITVDQLEVIYHAAQRDRIELFIDPINETLESYDIDTIQRQCAFIAQIGWESGQLRYVRELASGAAYDTGTLAAALGNTPEEDGDGEKYKGRGLIEITGTDNYRRCSIGLFGNPQTLLDTPTMLEQPRYAALSAGWYWKLNGLNELADTEDFYKITKKINGGFNGMAGRLELWNTAKSVLI